MTINNLQSALELWDNGFNIIRINSSIIPPTPENPAKDFQTSKHPQESGNSIKIREKPVRKSKNGMKIDLI